MTDDQNPKPLTPTFGVSNVQIGVYRDGQLFDVHDFDPVKMVEVTPLIDGNEKSFTFTPGSFTIEVRIYPINIYGAAVGLVRVYFGDTREQMIKEYVRALKNKLRGDRS